MGMSHRWRIVRKCGCRSTHFAAVHPQTLMKHPWRTSDTVLVVLHGCCIKFCGCTTTKWVFRHPHFHTIIHLWNEQFLTYLRKHRFATFKDVYCHIMPEWCLTTIQEIPVSLLSALETRNPSQGWAPAPAPPPPWIRA